MQYYKQISSQWPKPYDKQSLLPVIRAKLANRTDKLIVLDDDPTGCQTVHNIPIYTSWTENELNKLFNEKASVVYILTNSRSLTAQEAAKLNYHLGKKLRQIANKLNRKFSVVSRSDSTLRGHFPAETNALLDGLQMGVDGTLLVPFFKEGGRITFYDRHWVHQGEEVIPADQTPFAKDPSFGYTSSYLPDWVEEKTNGTVQAEEVRSISLEMLRNGGPSFVGDFLKQANGNQIIVVNAVEYSDLEVFVSGLLDAESTGKKFLYRTAASFVRVRGGMSEIPLLQRDSLINLNFGNHGGLFLIGSYVPLTTQQLELLLRDNPIQSIELDVNSLLESTQITTEEIIHFVNEKIENGQDVVVYTSRERVGGPKDQALKIGQFISNALVKIAKSISITPKFIISKGGITSSDIATKGLNVKRALVLGQALPGIPVWRLGTEAKFPDMPYIVFPGNVGDESSLTELYRKIIHS